MGQSQDQQLAVQQSQQPPPQQQMPPTDAKDKQQSQAAEVPMETDHNGDEESMYNGSDFGSLAGSQLD